MHRVASTLRAGAFLAVLAALASGCAGTADRSSLAPSQSGSPSRADSSQSDLLYIGGKKHIDSYAYPGGSFQERISTKFSAVAMCSDIKGNIFVMAVQDESSSVTGAVYKYAHGGSSPIATLSLPEHQLPVNCSSDPTSGTLAVTSYNSHNFAAQLNVYADASGTPHVHKNEALGAMPQPAYDDSGNLYVTSGGDVGVALPKGASRLVKVTTNVTLGGIAHAQWDGKYFALQSFTVAKHSGEHTLERVYRLDISGTTGKIVGFSRFVDWFVKDPGQSWIAGTTLIATPASYVAFWNYPGGGKSIGVLHPAQPGKAVTVSVGG